jgi:hypothetical protein
MIVVGMTIAINTEKGELSIFMFKDNDIPEVPLYTNYYIWDISILLMFFFQLVFVLKGIFNTSKNYRKVLLFKIRFSFATFCIIFSVNVYLF